MLDAAMNGKSDFEAMRAGETGSFNPQAKRSFQQPGTPPHDDMEPPLFYHEHSVRKPEVAAAYHVYEAAVAARIQIESERAEQIAPVSDGVSALINALKAESTAIVRYAHLLERSHVMKTDESPGTAPNCNVLTKREREVLNLVADGKTTKEIAFALGIAFKTAVCHRYRTMEKLGVHSSASLIRIAIKSGFVSP